MVRRGAVETAAEETTSSATYTLLTTHDEVANVVLPAKGLIFVGYEALAKVSAAANMKAAIFLNGNQLKAQTTSAGAPVIQEATIAVGAGDINKYRSFFTVAGGMSADDVLSGGVSSGDPVTTGQVLGPGGGLAVIHANPGAYTVSVRFAVGAPATLSVKDRRLYVEAKAYA